MVYIKKLTDVVVNVDVIIKGINARLKSDGKLVLNIRIAFILVREVLILYYNLNVLHVNKLFVHQIYQNDKHQCHKEKEGIKRNQCVLMNHVHLKSSAHSDQMNRIRCGHQTYENIEIITMSLV